MNLKIRKGEKMAKKREVTLALPLEEEKKISEPTIVTKRIVEHGFGDKNSKNRFKSKSVTLYER